MAGLSPTADPSTLLETLATVQDRLGWDNFIEGRIGKVFLSYVQPHLSGRRRRLSPQRWGTTFITHIISLTHKQWLFRNSHVHFKKLDGLTPAQHDEIFQRVQNLLWTDPAELLDRHKYLLEEDFHQLGAGSSGVRQNWIQSMESALKAAAIVKTGRQYRGDPGVYVPNQQYTNILRPSSDGSQVYRRCRRRAFQ